MDIFVCFRRYLLRLEYHIFFVCARILYLILCIKIHLPKGMILLGAVKLFKFGLEQPTFKSITFTIFFFLQLIIFKYLEGNARKLIQEDTLIPRNCGYALGTFTHKAAAFKREKQTFYLGSCWNKMNEVSGLLTSISLPWAPLASLKVSYSYQYHM